MKPALIGTLMLASGCSFLLDSEKDDPTDEPPRQVELLATISGDGSHQAFSIAATSDRLYVVGSLTEDAIFADGVIEMVGADQQAFLAVYDLGGTYIDHLVASASEESLAVGVDANESRVALVGRFRGDLTLPGGPPASSDGALDGFIASYQKDLALEWPRILTGDGTQRPNDIVIRPNAAEVLVVSEYRGGTLDFAGAEVFPPAVETDPHLLYLDSQGDVEWTNTGLGGPGIVRTTAAQFDNKVERASFVVGVHEGHIMPSGAERDAFVLRLDGTGRLDWAEGIPGDGIVGGNDLQLLTNGRVCATGRFASSLSWGPEQFDVVGDDDAYVGCLDEMSGEKLEVAILEGSGGAAGLKLAGGDELVAAGDFTLDLVLGELEADTRGLSDIYIAELSNVATPLRLTTIGGAGTDTLGDIAVLPDGTIIVVGTFDGPLFVDDRELASGGTGDIFIVAIHPPPSGE